MRSVLQRVALGAAMLIPSVATVACTTTCVYGYYGGYCYNYGYYYDSLVSGLSYESSGKAGVQTGVTGEVTGEETEPGPGSFRYVDGDTVSFSLGNTVLGETEAKDRITPFDLAGFDENPVGGCDVDVTLLPDSDAFRLVSNLAVLLQSLDTDENLTNGIDISPDVAGLFDGVDIDLSQAWEAFQANTELQAVLDKAKSRDLLPNTRVVRDRVEALRELYQGTGLCP